LETDPNLHKPYTRREIVIIILIIIVGAFVIGNFNTSTSAAQSTTDGPLTISENATCSGFGEPTYSNSLDPYNNVTTYQYGICLFGIWVSNGHAIGAGIPSSGTGDPLD
jgi:hypothetical protein